MSVSSARKYIFKATSIFSKGANFSFIIVSGGSIMLEKEKIFIKLEFKLLLNIKKAENLS